MTDTGRRRRRTSLRWLGGLLFVGLAAVVVATIVVGALVLQQVRADRNRLLERIDPAIEQLNAYENGLVGESAGARGFALSGQAAFSNLYRSSVPVTDAAAGRLAALVPTTPSARSALEALDHRVAAWRSRYLVPEASAARPGQISTAEITQATAAFAGVRRSFTALVDVLESEHRAALANFSTSLTVVEVFAGAVLAGVVLMLVLLYVALRLSILRPLVAVGDDSRRVTSGSLDHAVRAVGPAEIATLADAIEGMRARVVADLHALESAHAELRDQEQVLAARGEELARSNRDLEQFAYVASHDLQEPLRKVASFCQLLSDRYGGQLDERGEQYIAFAVDGAKRMQALVNDLLAFSRVGRAKDRWGSVDLSACLVAAEANLERRITEAGATVTSVDPLPHVPGDRSLLTALWQNLIGNSIKFRRDEAPQVVVRCQRQGDDWVLSVTDNGIGIEPEYADRVFTIFQRLHTRDRYEGTGIGLALCRRIVEFHGGTIAVDPDAAGAGGGTSIRFTLPATGTTGTPGAPETTEETLD